MSDSCPASPASDPGDHDLLRRFVLDGDEVAFADIVRRYQRLVMGVCRRVTGTPADAEDAFQAVFLVLARRPRSIRRARSLSSWLYTVAWRTSLRLVRQRRRKSMETLTQPTPSDDPDPLDQIAADQRADILHEELSLLPERYREVLVMTYFAQHTSQQIADQLQLTRGVVDGRIRQARNLLRVRLARRGVALSVLSAVSVSLVSAESAAAVSPDLLSSTIDLGTQTLTNTMPGTVDLTRLEPLIRPETALMNLKSVTVVSVCLAVIAGAAGMGHRGGVETALAAEGVPAIDAAAQEAAPAVSADPAAEVVTAVISTARPARAATAVGRSAGTSVNQSDLFSGALPSNVTDPGERWMHLLLSQPIPALDYRGETSLSEILDYLAEHYTQTYGKQGSSDSDGFRLTIWPDDTSLEYENIGSLDDVIVSDIRLEGIPLHQALDLIFDKTTDPPLTWDIRHGVFEVTTQETLEREPEYRVTRIYPVGHSSISGLQDLIQEHLRTQNIELLQSGEEQVDPSGQYGMISTIGDSLIVTHHRQAQEAVEKFLTTVMSHAVGRSVSATAATAAPRRSRSNSDRRADDAGYLKFTDESIVVNLNDERLTRFLSLSFMIQVDPELSDLTRQRMDAHTPVLRSWLVSHLAEKSLEDVRGADAQTAIKREIQERFNEVLFPDGDGQIRQVLFQDFAVQ